MSSKSEATRQASLQKTSTANLNERTRVSNLRGAGEDIDEGVIAGGKKLAKRRAGLDLHVEHCDRHMVERGRGNAAGSAREDARLDTRLSPDRPRRLKELEYKRHAGFGFQGIAFVD
jgi:hypothetical protein